LISSLIEGVHLRPHIFFILIDNFNLLVELICFIITFKIVAVELICDNSAFLSYKNWIQCLILVCFVPLPQADLLVSFLVFLVLDV
jgi:hypothetical protein